MTVSGRWKWCLVVVGAMGMVFDNKHGRAGEAYAHDEHRSIKVAMVQFDSVPEQTTRNLDEMERIVRATVDQGARWVLFHEGCLTDYTPRLDELAETIPDGTSCQRMQQLARKLDCYISFGMSERDGEKFYISQVFVGPQGYLYWYRKSWLWKCDDQGYRNEWARYDTGTGPEQFQIDGVAATCFICADGDAPRCIERARMAEPQVVFFPNNRSALPDFPVFGAYAAKIGAPLLVTNRVGKSWDYECEGGCVVFDANGKVTAKANRAGREEVIYHNLMIPPAARSTR